MDPAGIADLAANILATRAAAPDTLGLLQTPRARRHGAGVQLAYGHRRLAAFRLLAGQGHRDYERFPVEVADLSDADMAVVAWSENAVRADINLMEEAHFLRRLIDEFGWSVNTAAGKLGVPAGTLNNTMRLTRLPEDIQAQVAAGQIPRGRALELCGMLDRVDDTEVRKLAHAAGNADHHTFRRQINHARRQTETGADLVAAVIEPAAHVLAQALQADEPAAWLILARMLDPKAEDVDSAGGLAHLVLEKVCLRALSQHDGRQRVNRLFEAAGLEAPWNAAATARVTEFLAWKKKRTRRSA
jgi:ParB/RepB/Spo0J family partition protein